MPAWILFLALLGLLTALPLLAQTAAPAADKKPPLVTDRPDQTESAEIVPPGMVQIETGWVFTRDELGGFQTDTHEAPGTLARIGLHPRVELRVGWSGYVREETELGTLASRADGAGDAELGAKFLLHRERGPLPQLALITATSVPVGDRDFSSQRVDPTFRFSLAHTLSDRFSLGYNVGMVWASEIGPGNDRETLSHYLYTLVLGTSLTERVASFVEVFGEVAGSANGPPAHSFDGGFTFLLRPNLQLDVSSGVGLSTAAPDWFVGAGVSYRWPD